MKNRCLGCREGPVWGIALERRIAGAGGEQGCGGRFSWWRLTLRSEMGATFVIAPLA